MNFARSVSGARVVEAFSAITGVNDEVLRDFSSKVLNAVGKEIKKVRISSFRREPLWILSVLLLDGYT